MAADGKCYCQPKPEKLLFAVEGNECRDTSLLRVQRLKKDVPSHKQNIYTMVSKVQENAMEDGGEN